MRLVKRIRNGLIVIVAVGVAGFVAYEVFLDDEAKEGIRSLAHTLHNSYQQLSNVINTSIGTIMDEDVVAQNRKDVRDAWAEIGF